MPTVDAQQQPSPAGYSERVQFASEAADIGYWEVHLPTNTVIWDLQCQALFGLTKDHDIPFTEATRYIHPDDVNAVNTAVQTALAGENGGRYDMRYRTIGAADGQLRWVHFKGRAYFDEQGGAVRFGGVAQDVTASQATLENTERSLQDQGEDGAYAGYAGFCMDID